MNNVILNFSSTLARLRNSLKRYKLLNTLFTRVLCSHNKQRLFPYIAFTVYLF
jgi:hypothetical protein